jgi:hypothetical protein
MTRSPRTVRNERCRAVNRAREFRSPVFCWRPCERLKLSCELGRFSGGVAQPGSRLYPGVRPSNKEVLLRAVLFAAAIATAAIGSAPPGHSDPPCYISKTTGDCVPDPEQTPGGHHRQAGTPNAGMAATRSASTARVPVPAMVALNNGIHNGTRNDMKHDLTWVAGEGNSPLGTRSASSASDLSIGPHRSPRGRFDPHPADLADNGPSVGPQRTMPMSNTNQEQ